MKIVEGFCGGLKQSLNDLLDVIAPRRCVVCGASLSDGEQVMCIHCWMKLPETKCHLSQPNILHDKLFVSLDCHIEKAGAFMYYVKGSPYTQLIKQHKFNYRMDIGRLLARRYASELMKAGFFTDIDVVIPMPMFVLKFMWKAYNHAEEIAKGVCDATGLPLGDNLTMVRPRPAQKLLKGAARALNVSHLFSVKWPEELEDLHILLVDDVLTTGSTVKAAVKAIHDNVPSAKVSVLVLAMSAYQ